MVETLLIGHSHTQCIVEALQARSASVGWGAVGRPTGGSPVVVTADGLRLEPELVAGLRAQIGPATLCVSTIAGNAHNVLTLVAADPPFDFRTPSGTEPVDPDAVLIPYASVRLSFGKVLAEGDLTMLEATAVAVPEMRVHVESPPPLRDGALILSRMDPYFVERYPEAAVAAPGLRMKMWRLHSDLVREACHGLGIVVLPVPGEAQDEDGFLRPEYSHPTSSTHANTAYGALVADQIARLAR